MEDGTHLHFSGTIPMQNTISLSLPPPQVTEQRLLGGGVGEIRGIYLLSVSTLHINTKINKLISGIYDTVNAEGPLLREE